MIQVNELYKTFLLGGRSLKALKEINLKIEQGQFVSIMGPSGAGKSTLMHIMGGLDKPTSGSVLLGGKDLFKLPESALPAFRNRNIGFVFQFHYLLSDFTALENVMLPLMVRGQRGDADRKQAEELLDKVGLAGRKNHKPGELSGGEQQRVAIARALVTSPGLVLADEPTGNLDTHTGDELFDLLRTFNKEFGITFVIVTHNESLAAKCDRTIRMVDGMIVES